MTCSCVIPIMIVRLNMALRIACAKPGWLWAYDCRLCMSRVAESKQPPKNKEQHSSKLGIPAFILTLPFKKQSSFEFNYTPVTPLIWYQKHYLNSNNFRQLHYTSEVTLQKKRPMRRFNLTLLCLKIGVFEVVNYDIF
jgi:hypothetical protein